MNPPLPSLVIVDLDEPLYHFREAHEAGIAEVSRTIEARLGLSETLWLRHYHSARLATKRRLGSTASSHSRLIYFKAMLEQLGVGGHFDLALQLEHVYWQNFLRAMRETAGSKEFFFKCRELGIPVVVMTDLTLQIQLKKIIQLGLLHYFHAVITSEEVGADKPNTAFMDYARDELELNTSRVWLIGDDLSKDHKLAEKIGATFFHVNSENTSKSSFSRLLRVLGS